MNEIVKVIEKHGGSANPGCGVQNEQNRELG
jgi:hypothetical protein